VAHFTLYSRSYCHLCDDMLAALRALQQPQQPFSVTVIDIDALAGQGDSGPLQRFDALVPVLFGDLDAPPLCHYFFDEGAVRSWLDARSPAASA
jgi:hypothetical protein